MQIAPYCPPSTGSYPGQREVAVTMRQIRIDQIVREVLRQQFGPLRVPRVFRNSRAMAARIAPEVIRRWNEQEANKAP